MVTSSFNYRSQRVGTFLPGERAVGVDTNLNIGRASEWDDDRNEGGIRGKLGAPQDPPLDISFAPGQSALDLLEQCRAVSAPGVVAQREHVAFVLEDAGIGKVETFDARDLVEGTGGDIESFSPLHARTVYTSGDRMPRFPSLSAPAEALPSSMFARLYERAERCKGPIIPSR